ncbi:MAG: RNase H-like domain-containing protein, partial [Desulfobacterales bacterium]
ISHFSEYADPLYRVAVKGKFEWNSEQQVSFNQLKVALTTPPVLSFPNSEDMFVLDTDASDAAIGAELSQIQGGVEKVIAYGSFALSKEQRRYCVTRKELLAVIRFTRHFRHYLIGKPFIIRTDHSSLKWLTNFKEPQGQMARWLEELSAYTILKIEHRGGRYHDNADSLSRMYTGDRVSHWTHENYDVDPKMLPCGGCKGCIRMHNDWASFIDTVDDAVPLSNKRDKSDLSQENEVNRFSVALVSKRLVNECNTHASDISVMKLGVSAPPANVLPRGKAQAKDTGLRDGSGWSAGSVLGEKLMREKLYSDLLLTEIAELANGSSISVSDVCRAKLLASFPSDPLDGDDIDELYCILATHILCNDDDPSLMSENFREMSSMGGGIDLVIDKEGINTVENVFNVNSITSANAKTSTHKYSWGYSIDELRQAQKDEPEFEFLHDWVKKQPPDPAKLFLAGPAAKFWRLNQDSVMLIDDLFYYKNPKTDEVQLMLPQKMREMAMKLHHELPTSGHQGFDRTRARIEERFFWFGMNKDIRQYIIGCETCNRNKKQNRNYKGEMIQYHAGIPMERVHLDILGPLPKTPRGNEYILVCVDQFSKWVECVAIPNQTAETTARAAVDNIFCRLGVPAQIFTDQGRNFESKLFQQLCKILEIHKARTTPYRPSANGQVERYNRTLMDAIRCFVGKNQTNWDIHLQQIAAALRASVCRQTGYTPNKMIFGHEINTAADAMFPLPKQNYADYDEYVSTIIKSLQLAHEIARDKLKTNLKRMKRYHDLKVLERNYEVGDPVYLLDTASIKGKCKKLSSPWKGPGVIIKKLSSYVFQVKLKNSVLVINHDRLKPCRDAKLP